MTTKGKIVLIVAAVALVVTLSNHAIKAGWVSPPGIQLAVAPKKVTLSNQTDAKVNENIQPIAMPSRSTGSVTSTRFPVDIWEWNAYLAPILANGGKEPTRGSLMEKYNVNLFLHREDSNDQMKADLKACAEELAAGNKTCDKGAAAIIVMGDGAGQWLADMNPVLKKLGPDYQLEFIGAVGRSAGEDAALTDKRELLGNCEALKGTTWVGVIGDGDWNILLNYEGSCGTGIKNNPDLSTYDPDAVNWIGAPDNDYIKAVTDVYIPNRAEAPRKVIKNGKLTGESKIITPDGVVTWFPGDKLAVDGRPGTEKIISSKEYSAQMPAVVIGIKKFFADNRTEVNGFFAAVSQAADQIKAFPEAGQKAGEISAEIYGDKAYNWYEYYKGKQEKGVLIGGSAVFNIEDQLNFFGLNKSQVNKMKATYTMFGDIISEQYPKLFSKDHAIPPYAQVVDTSFIRGAEDILTNGGVTSAAAETVDYTEEAKGVERGKIALYIEFDTDKATPRPEGLVKLAKLKNQLAVNKALALQIDGFTDATGDYGHNVDLSGRRAATVKNYLQSGTLEDFPDSRFSQVKGHGPAEPIGSNLTDAGRRKNRRVEITEVGQ